MSYRTCDDCMNYRTQRGLVWCRYDLTPPPQGAQKCVMWDCATSRGEDLRGLTAARAARHARA